MTKTETEILVNGLRKLSADAAEIADLLSGPTAPEETPAEPTPVAKTYSKEDVRAILADKARAGFRAEVKSLLTAHGAKQLSDITDPEVLSAIVAEAEVIGNG